VQLVQMPHNGRRLNAKSYVVCCAALTCCIACMRVQAQADKVKAARKVTVVGGGPLGVELAGEILTVRHAHKSAYFQHCTLI
jgi:NADPH-dependent 2,4-dienoyl-CoA reductase/sulfur reductase-like enzyme